MRPIVASLLLAAAGLAPALGEPLVSAAPSVQVEYHPPKQIPLSQVQVENFVAALPDLKTLADTHKVVWRPEPTAKLGVHFGEQFARSLKGRGALGDFGGVLAAHGFSGADEWWQVAFSVMAAMRASDANEGAAHGDARLKASMAKVNSNPNLTEADKARFRAQLKAMEARYAAMAPPEGNIELIVPYKDKIREGMGAFKAKRG